MKRNSLKIGIICIAGLFLCACGSLEKNVTPAVTVTPKVIIVDPATPTPTLTPKEGEQPEFSEEDNVTSTPAPTPSEVTKEPEPTKAEAPTATPTPKPTKAPTATPEPTKAENRPYEKGVLTGTEFKSEWLGMKFTTTAGMELSPQKELDETMRLTEEAVSGKEIKGALDYDTLGLVYEMSLVWQDKGLNMQVLVERMADSSATEADYIAAMKEEMSLLEESGFTYIVDDKTYSETIAGKEYVNFGYTTYYGSDISLRQENYIRKQGDRMILISIMGESEAGMQDLLDLFKKY